MSRKRKVLLIFSALLFIIGLFFASTNAYSLIKTYVLYKQSKDDFKKEIKTETATKLKQIKKNEPLYKTYPKFGEEMGTLTIPRIEATLPIFHGTDEDELAKGIGHYAKSVMPGERDNSVLAGHRDTVFRHLGEVKIGDSLIVKTSAGTFTYKVHRIRIVDKDDRTVIIPKPRPTLTVSTCYPFNFIGHAPKRYILVASLVKSEVNK
ncbi:MULTISPECIES: class D sortase [unclassified Bacillus (in: firmicutes)]|uniref:class D sortase n=1 Tax=Bacillaceae TaxID=186817 RepID=UPI000BF009B5|nr:MULTISPECIES: class D sortase [unclassified Bacillus (in: firmicutes)]PEL11128.1 class D sortase [Bacillus sp. AFS017336]